MDDREQLLQREPTCHASLSADDGNCHGEDFWQHLLNRIRDKVEENQARDNA
jgi:hypothetical protein